MDSNSLPIMICGGAYPGLSLWLISQSGDNIACGSCRRSQKHASHWGRISFNLTWEGTWRTMKKRWTKEPTKVGMSTLCFSGESPRCLRWARPGLRKQFKIVYCQPKLQCLVYPFINLVFFVIAGWNRPSLGIGFSTTIKKSPVNFRR